MNIEAMTEVHRGEVFDMMRVFDASPALLTNGSEEIFRADIDACIGGSPCMRIEDLYRKPEYLEMKK